MRVLVTWGSKRGGTEGIGRMVGDALQQRGFEVVLAPGHELRRIEGFDAVIVGGALYANRWTPEARRFVRRHLKALRSVPVWFFSSGPLDDSATRAEIPPTSEVAVLAERVGARGHATFGGRLAPDAKGFPAAAMAKKHSGDWRDPEHIGAWAAALAADLPRATPGAFVEHSARSLSRLLGHGAAGWAACAAIMGLLLATASTGLAVAIHALAAPLVFAAVAVHYFKPAGARDPLPTALAWTLLVALLDLLVVAGTVMHSLEMFRSVPGTWLPFALIFASTWATGAILAMRPLRRAAPETGR